MSWLRTNQNGDGGFGQFKGRDSNAQSTSYAVQGLLAAGAGGSAVSRARAYLVRLQRSDGSVAYSSTSAQTPVWVTAQALMALRGKPLPLAAVPRSKRTRANAASDRRGRRGSGSGRWRQDRLEEGRRSGSRRRRGLRSGQVAPAAEAVGGATAAGEPAPTNPESTSALAAAAPESGAAHPKPVPVWAALLAAAGLVALLWVINRYVLSGRWPGMG